MSIQAQSTFCFCRCANAARPRRRLLLSGFPLVLITRCFDIGISRKRSTLNAQRPTLNLKGGADREEVRRQRSDVRNQRSDVPPSPRLPSSLKLRRDKPARQAEARTTPG